MLHKTKMTKMLKQLSIVLLLILFFVILGWEFVFKSFLLFNLVFCFAVAVFSMLRNSRLCLTKTISFKRTIITLFFFILLGTFITQYLSERCSLNNSLKYNRQYIQRLICDNESYTEQSENTNGAIEFLSVTGTIAIDELAALFEEESLSFSRQKDYLTKWMVNSENKNTVSFYKPYSFLEQYRDDKSLWAWTYDGVSQPYQGEFFHSVWTGNEYPDVENWLKQNDNALNIFSKFIRYPDFYIPIFYDTSSRPSLLMCQLKFVDLTLCFPVSNMLRIRANYYIGTHDFEKAYNDIISLFLLAKHIQNHSHFLVQYYASGYFQTVAAQTAFLLVEEEELSQKQTDTILTHLTQFQSEKLINNILPGERLLALDVAANIIEGKLNLRNERIVWSDRITGLKKLFSWGRTIKTINERFDQLEQCKQNNPFAPQCLQMNYSYNNLTFWGRYGLWNGQPQKLALLLMNNSLEAFINIPNAQLNWNSYKMKSTCPKNYLRQEARREEE